MPSRVRCRSWEAYAGVLAPALLIVMLVALTLADRRFLARAGWSAIHRTQIEWPSVLALAPYGWVETATFIVCGALGLLFAKAMAARWRTPALSIAVISLALALEAFRPDRSAAAPSWHGQIHDGAYPAIPLGLLIGCVALSRVESVTKGGRRLSLLCAAVTLAGMALGLFQETGQLGRYVLIGGALTWIISTATLLVRADRLTRLAAMSPEVHRGSASRV